MRADLEDARQGLGRVPQGRPPLPGPGEQYWRLKQVHAETVDEARRRAKAMPWGAKVRRGPSLCRRDADLLASGWSSIVDIEREAAGLLLAGEWRA